MGNGKNVLVTGGAGNLGNYVCPYLKGNGYNVVSFDRTPQKPDSPNGKADIPYVNGELTELGDVMRAISFAQADIIVHLGAIPFNVDLQPPFAPRYANPQITDGARFVQTMPEKATMEINTMGSYYVMDAARRLDIKTVVAASSYFVLGLGFRLSGTSFEPKYLPIDEEHPLLPEDTYSLSKVLGEEIYQAYVRAYGTRVVAMRLLGVHYPNAPVQFHKFDITPPVATPENKGYLVSDTLQYVDARDIAVFVKLSIEAQNLSPFEAFYVATDTKYRQPTVEVIAKRWPFLTEKAKNIPGTEGIISIKKAERLLGYKPQYSWRKEVK